VPDDADGPSLQERYAPGGICFGCGPANPDGLRVRSFWAGSSCVATWQPRSRHQAFPGVLSGGVISTLLDCHANWTAATHLMERRGLERPPVTVTAELRVRLLRPTPVDGPVRLEAEVSDVWGDRVTVDGRLLADGQESATARATLVAVGQGHPAYDAWTPAPDETDSASLVNSADSAAGR
jgi:acyl-coenzyme A thioesterase PaaI-like protein